MDDLVVMSGRRRLIVAAALILTSCIVAAIGAVTGAYGVVVAYQVLIMVAAVLGYNLFSGVTGYISFGHGMLYGIGGYAAVALASLLYPSLGHAASYIAIILAGIIATVFAVASFGPLLRVRGAYFSISSLALFFAAAALASSIPGLGGSAGLSAPSGAGLSPLEALIASLILVSLVILAYYALSSVRLGRVAIAVRDSEEAAQSLGFNPVPYRLAMLTLSGLIVGAAGGIYFLAYGTGHVEPQLAFDPRTNLLMVLASLAGGLGSLTGAYIMGLVFRLIDSAVVAYMGVLGSLLGLGGVKVRAIPFLVYGGLVALVALTAPRGLYGLIEGHAQRLASLVRVKRRHGEGGRGG